MATKPRAEPSGGFEPTGGPRLSRSVAALPDLLGDAPVTGVQLVAALFEHHDDYARELSRPLPLDPERGDRMPAAEWIARGATVFLFAPGDVLHGRLLVVAVALLDPAVGGQLLAAGALTRVVRELADAPPLAEEGERRWRIVLGEHPYPPLTAGAAMPGSAPAVASRAPATGTPAAHANVAGPPNVAHAPAAAADAGSKPASDAPADDDAPATPVQYDERVATHADDPAVVDQLGRRPFATVVADRIRDVWAAAPPAERASFMVHLHGPWGSGKSSLLNFLAHDLREHARARGEPEPLVVEFNAWRHQRLRPPWWALMREIHEQAVRALDRDDRLAALRLRLRWRLWRARLDWLPVVVALLLLVLGAPLAWFGARAIGTSEPTAELPLKLLATLLTLGAAAFALSRSLVFGSARAAETYADLRTDPLDPIVRLFGRLARATGRPLVVFIDDLDRCDAAQVVELLEGIQTLFRSAPVTYVVAADRKWICSSFETRYAGFGAAIGEPGRPLGYLFLDKIFQISAPVPRPLRTLQARFWAALLRGGDGGPALDRRLEAEQAQALRSLGAAHTPQELERHIATARAADPSREYAMRAAAARRITSPEAQREAEHRLRDYARLLEPNPRAMKRLVNAYGLHQATHVLEGRTIAADALARWTIVELRWPVLAEHLAADPVAVAHFAAVDAAPEPLRALLAHEQVRRVVLGGGAGDPPGCLDAPRIRDIVGDDASVPAAEAAPAAVA